VRVRLVVQNLAYGALRDGDGNPEDRWPLHVQRINAVRPDILLLNEAVGWDDSFHRQLGRAMDDLDLDAVPLPPSRSGYRSAILYRTATVGRWKRYGFDKTGTTTHGFVTATFTVGDLPSPLTVAAGHIDPDSGDHAIAETKTIATRAYRFGPFAVIGVPTGSVRRESGSPSYSGR
jgi:hypothetical protein